MTPTPPPPEAEVQTPNPTARAARSGTITKVLVWLVASAYLGLYIPGAYVFFALTSALGVTLGWVIGILVIAAPIAVIAPCLRVVGARPWSSAAFTAVAGRPQWSSL